MDVEPQKAKTCLSARYSRQEVNDLLKSYRSSSLTQKQWCEKSGIKVSTLGFWLRREREASEGYSLVAVKTDPTGWVDSRLRIRLNGVELELEAGMDLLAQLVKRLVS